MEIRTFDMDDYDRVVQLWRSRGIKMCPSDTREAIEKKLARDPDLFLVADSNGAILGAVVGAWDGRQGWIYNAAVDQAVQRRGVGRLLAEELEKRLQEKGARQVGLLVGKDNYYAQDFFEALGFQLAENERVMTKPMQPGQPY